MINFKIFIGCVLTGFALIFISGRVLHTSIEIDSRMLHKSVTQKYCFLAFPFYHKTWTENEVKSLSWDYKSGTRPLAGRRRSGFVASSNPGYCLKLVTSGSKEVWLRCFSEQEIKENEYKELKFAASAFNAQEYLPPRESNQ
jgi:hypothetical protein